METFSSLYVSLQVCSTYSERPGRLLLSGCHPDPHLGPILGPARPGPIPGPKGVPSRFAMCFVLQHFGLIPRAWTGRNRILGHFRHMHLSPLLTPCDQPGAYPTLDEQVSGATEVNCNRQSHVFERRCLCLSCKKFNKTL